jgi:mRNA interferase RelE/StbE
MSYQVIFKPRARRELEKLPRVTAERIAQAIDGLRMQPRPPGCRKLSGVEDLWRVRVGDWRIIYQIKDKCLIVMVVRIGHRRDIYD